MYSNNFLKIKPGNYRAIIKSWLKNIKCPILKKPLTPKRQGLKALIHLHILFAFPRMNLSAEHIPFDFFCF